MLLLQPRAHRSGFTLCKALQMRETVSTVPPSTLLLHLDKVMLETARVRLCVGGVCRRVRACARMGFNACGRENQPGLARTRTTILLPFVNGVPA